MWEELGFCAAAQDNADSAVLHQSMLSFPKKVPSAVALYQP